MTDNSVDPEDPEEENELFQLFRGLRERVFVGSSELVSRVMRGVEERIEGKPEESLAASVLVQLTNFVTSWLGLDEQENDGGSTEGTDAPPPPRSGDAPPGDDEE